MPPKFISIQSLNEADVNAAISKKIQEKQISHKVSDATRDKSKDYFKMIKHANPKPNLKQELNDHITKMKCEVEEQKLLQQQIVEVGQSEEGNIINRQMTNLLTLPVKDAVKKRLFEIRLKQNVVIQDYMNNTLAYTLISKVNKNMRFCAHVGLEYIGAEQDYKILVHNQNVAPQQPVQPSSGSTACYSQ